jgi:hypothetical protein
MRAAQRLVLHHECGLNSVCHTSVLFSDIVVMEYSPAAVQLANVFAYEEVEKGTSWTRYQFNSNADDGNFGGEAEAMTSPSPLSGERGIRNLVPYPRKTSSRRSGFKGHSSLEISKGGPEEKRTTA